jgi:hypothetical protein
MFPDVSCAVNPSTFHMMGYHQPSFVSWIRPLSKYTMSWFLAVSSNKVGKAHGGY